LQLSVAIIGAGVSGLATGLRLERSGTPFTIFEKASEVGGTWRENRYPGLTIDVPSPIYTFSGHRNPHWRRLLPDAAEILAYHRDVSFRTGLRERIRFDCEIVAARWTGGEWELTTSDGDRQHFRVVVCATGFLHHPRLPDIDGLDSFAGTCVHSARWRDDIEVRGRRVGVIGNGSTGVQLVAALAGFASRLSHFQRTPQWIFPGPSVPIPPRARLLLARRPALLESIVMATEWFADWLLCGAATAPNRRRRVIEALARRQLQTVRDPELRARLTPRDSALCKRPVVSSTYYRAIQRPNVELVSERIARIEPAGVRTADGILHELDVLVLATGFQAHNYMRPMTIEGPDGLTLEQAWADGPVAYRTVAITGFPNLFTIMGPHSPLLSFPVHTSAELQADYVASMLEVLARDDVASVSPTTAATERWLAEIRAGMPGTVWASGCSSWYLGGGETPVLWPYGRRRWRELLREPLLADYDIGVRDASRAAATGTRALPR
jgi:cation diffusion facilitator CzcD-associated flavoprotein CzcO